jgi:Tfp pilus assembly protein PilV
MLEIVVSIGIVATILTGLIGAFRAYVKAGLSSTEKIQATFLLEEGLEATRFIRNGSWDTLAGLATSTDYYLVFTANTWEATTTTTTVSFTRLITVEDVFRRDSDSKIVATTSPDSKSFDPNTKFITVKVSSPVFTEIKLSTYMANIF